MKKKRAQAIDRWNKRQEKKTHKEFENSEHKIHCQSWNVNS